MPVTRKKKIKIKKLDLNKSIQTIDHNLLTFS